MINAVTSFYSNKYTFLIYFTFRKGNNGAIPCFAHRAQINPPLLMIIILFDSNQSSFLVLWGILHVAPNLRGTILTTFPDTAGPIQRYQTSWHKLIAADNSGVSLKWHLDHKQIL